MSAPTLTEDRLEEARRYMPGGVNTSLRAVDPPVVWRRAQGAYLYDAEGRRYVDYHAAFGPILLGHAHPAITARVSEVARELDLIGVGVTDLEIELARKIAGHVPSAEQVLFCNSGSEATYHAVRLARAVTGRRKVIKFQGCYHGWHDYLLMNVITPPERLGHRDPLSAGSLPEALEQTLVLEFNNLEQVEETMASLGHEVAAIILEPIPHNIGAVLPRQDFLEGLRRVTAEQGTLLVFDEVITGFRHGLGGYQAICGVTPDLTTLGKALANGYPCAAICGAARYMERFNTAGGDVFFAGTFNGHPAAMAAGLATVEALEQPGFYDRLFRLGDRMREGLTSIVARRGLEAYVTGFGSVFVLYFLEPPVTSYSDLVRNDARRYVGFHRGMVDRGFFMLPLNLKRNHISASHREEDIDRTLEAAEEVLAGL